jgi:hypothetical protein
MKKELINELMTLSAMIASDFKEYIHLKFKDRYEAFDIITKLARTFYLEFRDLIENDAADWTDVFTKYGADSYDDLVHLWTEQKLAQQYDITIGRG